MDIFTVSLFGHREVEDLRLLDALLAPLVKELILSKQYVSFLIGRNGEFDEYAASVIKRVQRSVGNENSDITLVLPYKAADIEFYEKYYDSVLIAEGARDVYPKAAIAAKNRWMVEHSDLVIVYVKRDFGGAYTAMKYAERLNKPIVSLTAGKSE